MLKLLSIENIILVDAAQIPFERGLNILSGETGAGKSAVMQALRLLAGEKGDPKLIRHGADKSIVEALFELPTTSGVWALLEQAGLNFDREEPLIIRRELSLQGKSRAFINHQLASLPLLRDIGEALFDIASQHASQKLISESFQRAVVDLWADLEEEVKAFSKSWDQEKQLQAELELLVQGEARRLREIEVCTREVEEIDEAKFTAEEDVTLFQEYASLATSEERFSTSSQIVEELSAFPLSRLRHKLSELINLDTTLKPYLELFDQVKIELDEIAYALNQYQSRIAFDPAKMERLDARLQMMTRLKKKYGQTIEAILAWREEQQNKLRLLNSSDERIETLKLEIEELGPKNDQAALAISQKRKKRAEELAKKITCELQQLNMPKAEFYIEVVPAERTKTGQDRVLFLFQPNIGGKKMAIKESASGGELARILLAIKTVLADKAAASLLIFDEVDANIGGETARLLGEKLQQLGKTTQVIAITHFPQVAAQAHHHLRVQKIEINGQTRSIINTLTAKERESELARMVGA